MPTLTDEIKTFIVIGLARYDTPSEVAQAVGVNFGVEITRQQVHAYDPACSKPPAPEPRDDSNPASPPSNETQCT